MRRRVGGRADFPYLPGNQALPGIGKHKKGTATGAVPFISGMSRVSQERRATMTSSDCESLIAENLSPDRFLHQDNFTLFSVLWTPQRLGDSALLGRQPLQHQASHVPRVRYPFRASPDWDLRPLLDPSLCVGPRFACLQTKRCA